jgi:hypothetical protein
LRTTFNKKVVLHKRCIAFFCRNLKLSGMTSCFASIACYLADLVNCRQKTCPTNCKWPCFCSLPARVGLIDRFLHKNCRPPSWTNLSNKLQMALLLLIASSSGVGAAGGDCMCKCKFYIFNQC